MPNSETTTKFKVDISELKSAMQEAKRQVQIANSEFKAVSSSMDDWSKSSDGISAKLKQLDSNLASEEKILSSLEEQYKLTVEQMGEGSAQADKLKVSINNQKAVINNTKKEINKYETSLKDVEKAEDIAAKTGKTVDEVLDDMAKSTKEVDKAADDAAKSGFTVFKGALADLVAQGISKAIEGAKNLGKSLVELGLKADDLNTLSAQSGFSTEMLQKFEYAADRIDVDVDTIVSSARKMKKNMVSNSADTAEAFERLGVKVTDANGELRDSNEVFFEVVEALSGVNNETERDTLAMQIFGKSADDLAGIIDDGGAALKKYGEEAEDVGAIMSQELLDGANEFNDSVDEIKATTKGMFNKIGAEIARKLVPEVKDLAKKAGEAAKKIDWSKIIDTVMSVLKKFISIVKNLASSILPTLLSILGFVADNFDTLIGIVIAGVTAFQAFKAAMAISETINAFRTAVSAATTAVGAAQKAQLLWNAAMSANVIGAVISLVASLVVGIGYLVGSTDDATSSTDKFTESERLAMMGASDLAVAYKEAHDRTKELIDATQETIDKATEEAEKFADVKSAADEVAEAELGNIENTQKLWDELQTLTTENGKVKDGYEARAQFILNELNGALGTEYEMNGNIITQYGDMQKEVDKLIEKKKAQILLTAYEESYREAVESVKNAELKRSETAQRISALEDELLAKEQEVAKARERVSNEYDERSKYTLSRRASDLEDEADALREMVKAEKETYNNSVKDVQSYYETIDNYEIASTLVLESKTTEAIGYLNKLGSGFKTVANTSRYSADEQIKILKQQVVDTEVNLRLLQEDYETTAGNLTSAQRKEAENRLNNAKEEAKKAKEEYVKVGGNLVKGMAQGVNESSWELDKATEDIVNSALKSAKSAADIHSPSRVFRDEVGKNIALGVAEGIEKNEKYAEKSVKEMNELILKEAKKRVKELKETNELSLAAEVSYWNEVKKHVKKGSDAYKEATNEAKKAKKNLIEEYNKLDETYLNDFNSVKDQLTKDVQSLTDSYTNAVASRQKAILSSLGLFDKFEAKEAVSKETLIDNLASQAIALEQWHAILTGLSQRKGMTIELMDELESMGVDNLETLKAILSMSDEEFAEYVRLYEMKDEAAKKRSEKENEALKTQTETQIKQLINEANNSLAELEKTYKNNLDTLKNSVKAKAKKVGKGLADGLKEGLQGELDGIMSQLNTFMDGITDKLDTARSSLGTVSISDSGATKSGGSNGVVNNYTQVINSPIPVSRIDIYRDTKNLLGYTGGVIRV